MVEFLCVRLEVEYRSTVQYVHSLQVEDISLHPHQLNDAQSDRVGSQRVLGRKYSPVHILEEKLTLTVSLEGAALCR